MIRGAKQSRRGASLQRRRAPLSWRQLFSGAAQWREWLAPGKTVAWLCFALATAVLFAEPVKNWLERPVGAVKVSSQLRYVKQDAVIAVVAPLLQRGYWQTDLATIERELESLTWVDAVTVSRVWPDSLDVQIVEQQAIARWGEDQLISYRGNVFRPDSIKGFDQLPRLAGPLDSQSDVMQRFSVLSDLLRSNQLQLVALSLDVQGNWHAELAGGVMMEFGGGDLMEKVQRFLLVYRHSLQPRFEQVARIDLRYGTGLAVGWREVAPANAPVAAPSIGKAQERQG